MNQSVHEYHIVHIRSEQTDVNTGAPGDFSSGADGNLLIYRSPLIRLWASPNVDELFNAVLNLEAALVKLKFSGGIIRDLNDQTFVLIIPETVTIGPFPQTNELNHVLNAYGLRFGVYDYEFRIVADMEVLEAECFADALARLRTFIRYVGSINVEALELIGKFWKQILDPLVNDVSRQLDSSLILDLPTTFRQFES